MADVACSDPAAPLVRETAVTEEQLSPEATAALVAGIESARRGEIKRWGDFTQYIDADDE